ncbi:MAG: sigma-70 family RNA polymerase sigma factor [Pseudomonadales bacterium]
MTNYLHRLRADESLMMAYQRGDASAFEVLYARHRLAVFAFLRRSGAPADNVEALFQEAWMAIIRNIDSYQPSASFKTYLYQVAHRKLIDYWRKHKEEVSLDDNVVDTLPEHNSALGNPEVELLNAQVSRVIQQLPDEQRCTVVLRQQGFSQREIADITKVGTETVKSRLRYATRSLRTALAGVQHE